ncbi:cellulase family glycosylhydrolase [Lederbergia sp. NSJ-179]|uniref:cellulase family glycosylhydrolase n=1 Tax=Lederbergia sp. NSJ-179 TaxID=2931402 RepID=UPI001FD3B15D|nr:cellulase family glycosylhydrolase [Lederbergia sp. NSJ-179]MCJ7843124.1 cellulase family glycosylhydrolase [Lederbergia sp. NSJ-179]
MKQYSRNSSFHLFARLLFAAILVLSLFPPIHSLAAGENETNNNDIQSYVEDMQPGWNLGNTFDAVGKDETAWGNPRVTEEFIKQIAAQDFKSIRIPVTFDQRQAEGPDYIIDADFLERLDQVVQWSLNENLYVMINIHHDSWIWLSEGMQNNHDETLARYEATWEQLADHFKNYSSKLMFESINEPQFNGSEQEQFKYLKELNTSFHQIVRDSGGKNDVRPLVLPTLFTDSEPEILAALYETIVELNDPNIISTVHYYGFWPFSVNIDGYTHFEEDTKNDILSTFDRVHDTFVANGIPVIIGEYGLLGFDTDMQAIEQGEKLKFFEFMLHCAQEKGLTHMLWDNGQHFSRTSFEWSDPELYHLIKTSWKTRSATADSDLIYVKKGEEIKDQKLSLDLNGNQFVSLQLDGQELVTDQDYEWDGKELTFKADMLKELTATGTLGTNAVLTATFDQGADWAFHVITSDTPILENTEGTVDNFSIPTSFNGDKLATMEAFYTDGAIAGPQDWTSFKEFGYTFSPDYETSEIIIKKEFFNESHDGEIRLTFHFWSGEEISYTLTKDGNNISGKAMSGENETPGNEEGPGDDHHNGSDGNDRDHDNGPHGNDGDPVNDHDDGSRGNNGDPGNNHDDGSQGDNGVSSDDFDNRTPKPSNDGKINEENHKLPNTSTNLYNYLFLGLTLVLIGGIFALYLYFRKRKLRNGASR